MKEGREQTILIKEKGGTLMGIYKEAEESRRVKETSRDIKIEDETLIMKGKGGVDMGKPPSVVPGETLRAYPRPPANHTIVDSAQNVVIEEEKTPHIGNIILEEMGTQYIYNIYIYKIYIYIYI